MLQRFPIRLKLAIALAVPLVALLVVAVFEAVQTGRERNDIRRQADLAEAALGPGSLLSKLEDERNAAAIGLLGVGDLTDLPVEDQATARAATDAARAEFEQDLSGQSAETRETYGPAIEGLGQLDELRTQVDGFTGPRDIQSVNETAPRENFEGYSTIMTRLFDANRQVALEIDDPDLRRGAQLIDLSARQSDLHAKLAQLLVLAAASRDGVNTSTEIASISALRSELTDNERSIRTKAAGSYQPLVDTLLSTDHIQAFPALVDDALASPNGQVNASAVLGTAGGPSAEEFGYTVFRDAVAKELRSETDDKTGAADTRVWLFRGLALAAVLVAGVATWAVSRSITRPLRALTRQATDMASNRLPDAVLDILDTPLGDDVTVPHVDPIAVQTRDEVSDVAEALNTVQDSALDLAVEQAVLRRNIADSFVNLGRRNQNLLGRQLDFITELEHNETDPDTLANLFRLDHLATRMRRNAESLLVLAGIDPPRKWAAPVRITDAIRAALGEVEDYQRVTVRAVEPATILGSAAADLAHLLAELIENALIFSPPDQTVEIRGRAQPAGYTLAIIDSGLGMPPEELARANRRLAGAESFTIAPSKYLGHYVAGNLAARHNINVTLHNSPGHGITATINLPPTLLTTEPTGTTAGGAPADTAPGAPQLSAEFTPGPDRSPKPRQQPARLDTPERPARPERVQGLPAPEPAPDPAPLAAPLLADQTSGGLTKRSSQSPAIPTSGRAQPVVPSDDLLETLANYTTQLHEQLSSPQGAAPTVGGPTDLDPRARDRGRDRDDEPGRERDDERDPAPPLPGRGADPFGDNGRLPAGPRSGADGPGRIPTSGRSGIIDNGSGSDPLADLAAWSESSTSLPPTQPTPVVSPTGFADGPGGRGPGPNGPGRGAPPDYAEARGGSFDGPGRGPGVGAGAGRGGPGSSAGPDGPWGPPTGAPGGPDAWGPPTGAPSGPGAPGAGDARPPLAARAPRGHDGPAAPGTPPSSLGRPAPGDGAPPVLPSRPHFGDPTESRPQLAARHPDGVGDGGRPPLGAAPGMPGAPPAGPPADPGAAGQTQGGLARRVRGAQMPTTEPLSLRRGSGGGGQRQGPPGQASSPFAVSPPVTDRSRAGRSSAPEVPATNGDHRAADEVYGFLSSFTAGVQRGLDESRRDPDDPDA